MIHRYSSVLKSVLDVLYVKNLSLMMAFGLPPFVLPFPAFV